LGSKHIFTSFIVKGYDMEDAMIISKSAFERGFGHGCIYKSEHIDLKYVLQNTSTQVDHILELQSEFIFKT
jgi:DNA-directed RNA polymerase I subunit RPA2